MADADLTRTVVEGVIGLLFTGVSALGARAVRLMDKSVKDVAASVKELRAEVAEDRKARLEMAAELARLQERTQGRHDYTLRLIEEHGRRIAYIEMEPSRGRRR